ncbi:10506_t:CDS:2, partial [Scutellospora calospora]
DPVDSISAFFKDPSGVKVTKFIEKLRELSDDSKKTFDEIEYESQNFSSVFDDNYSNYMPRTMFDLDCNNDHISKKDPSKIDKVAFWKTHNAIPDTTKLKLSTGKIVEDILFNFCKDMDYEHHAHSYIVDFDNENIKALFIDSEWKELTKDRIGVPIILHDIIKELAKYKKEWIQLAIRTLVNLYENMNSSLIRTQYEHWFTVALLGTCIDFCLRDIRLGTDIKRIDASSSSSANRKNRSRKANIRKRKLVGRKIDGIIYTTDELLEFEAIEGARAVNYDDQKANKLQVIGILHLGL